MMFTLQEKVHSVKTQFLQNAPFFTKEEFIELFAILRPQYDLDDESAGKIFDTTDKSKEGKIPKDEVERILDAVIESEDHNDMSNSSIVLDAKVSVLLKSGKASIAAPKISETRGSTQVRNVPDDFFTDLDLNKITEIKHIFSICEKNKGYVTIDQIKDFINDVKQFSCSPQELIEIFNYMKDEKTNTITSEMFYNKITEAEKAILGAYMGGQDFEERSRMGTQSFMIDDAASEYYAAEYNPSMFEQEDFVDKLEHTYNQNLDQDFNWIVQKIKSVIDEARRSSRQVDIVSILNEIVNLCPQLENKLKSNDAVYKEANEKWTEQNKMEEFLRMRIANFELESKQQKEFLLNLQNENENLCVTIGELESKINLDHQTQKDLIEKNNEIVRLERSVRERESEKDELKDYIKSVESENQTLTQNYKEIQALLKNMDKDMETDENMMNGSTKSKNLLELESLQLELRTALNKIEDIEKEKINMKDINNELKEQLSNSKEFIDTLRLEKNDLQTRLDKLQKELEALRSENFGKASAFLQSSKRVSSMKDSLVRAMGFSSTPLLRVSHRENPSPGLRQINEEEEEIAGIQMANSEIMSKKSVVSPSNEPEINHFMTAPSILKSKRKEENSVEVMEEAKCITIPTEQKVAAQTMDLMNDVQFSESPVVVMKQSEVKEEENNNVDNLLLESMSIPQVRLSTVPKPKPVVEVSAKMEEQKMESLIHPLSSVKPVSTLKETSDKKVHLDSVSLVESQVAIEPQPVVAPVHMNQPQNANDRASLQALPFDLRNLDQDYLDLLNKLLIQELLRSNGELINYGVCFSDNVYRITSKEQRNYRVLLITNQALYCLHPGNYQVKRKIPLEKISKITMSETSAGLFAIHVPKEYDYVMDTFKRLNLILFLQTLFKAKNLKLFPIIYKQNLSVRNRGQTLTKQISQYDKSVINPNLQTTYKSTKKFGDLYLETKMIFTIWKKYFFVVTNLGLLYYKREGSQKPVDFIPFVGYQIIDNNEIKDNKFIFRIKFPHSNYVATLGASSDMEKREWLKAIIEAKEAQEKKENQESSVMNKK